MSPYKWGPSNYLCPHCKRRLEAKAGPDGLKAERCPNCDWSKVFDPNADEFSSQELERARLATDGGRSEGELRRFPITVGPPALDVAIDFRRCRRCSVPHADHPDANNGGGVGHFYEWVDDVCPVCQDWRRRRRDHYQRQAIPHLLARRQQPSITTATLEAFT